MRYFIPSAGHRVLYDSRCGNEKTPVSFGPASVSVAAGPVNMEVKEWRTPRFRAVLMQYQTNEEVRVIGETPTEMVTLCFMGQGKTDYQCRQIRTTGMVANTNNFFYLPRARIIYQPVKDEPNECFKISISPDYIHVLSDRFPGVFGLLSEKIRQKRPFELGATHLITSLEMNRIIEQIKHCRKMGSLAPLYFETKVRELLALQWQLPLAQQQPANGCFARYHDQINQARNILEQAYRNPPGIRELSLQVGMCETLLKSGFKSVFGVTVFHYLFNYRMDRARRLLTDRSLNISGIAEELGYKNLSHFTTAFKRKFDLSPMQYRKRNRAL
ncbi:helix-turn-helix domain-containing protein [Gaoshiqia sp. Z1-71]|uniref:helix-turn-helix domain-containing protein n=1 Tax=Gaoshiqia hydrogeniformans TaxID=3290090 RepID=UPI003BF90399